MKNHSKKRGILAAGGALATIAALVLGGAVSATAAPTVLPTDTHGNLHITKLSTPDNGGVTSNGTIVSSLPVGADPIGGVTFTVTKLNGIDLATNAGWQLATQVSLNASGALVLPGGVTSGTVSTGYTDASGVPRTTQTGGIGDTGSALAFQSLPIGVYYVQETATPAGVTAAAPFLVTLPITDPATQNSWLYDVYAYPKNSQVGFTKSVVDSAAYVPGNTVSYVLNADVPRVNTGTQAAPVWAAPTQFAISDAIDARLTPGAITVEIVDAAGTQIGAQPIAGTHYTASAAGVTPVTVTFDAPGFTLLQTAAATAGSQVRVTIATTVGGAPAGPPVPNGDIANGGAGTTLNFTVSGKATQLNANEVLTKWRSVNFTKVAHEDTNEELAGAVFALFSNKTNAQAGTSPLVTSAATDSSGVVALNNVRVSDWQNGSVQQAGAKSDPQLATCDIANTNYRVYWLAETTAPADRELLAAPLPVVVNADGSISTVALGAGDVPTFNPDCSANLTPLTQVENVKKNAGFVLPLTGGMGTAILTILGVGILAVVLVVARRRRSAEAAE